MGDDIGLGLVTDCRLRSESDPLSSTKLPYGENQNKPFYRVFKLDMRESKHLLDHQECTFES